MAQSARATAEARSLNWSRRAPRGKWSALALLAVIAAVTPGAHAGNQVMRVDLIARAGLPAPGSGGVPLSSVSAAFTNGDGEVGFLCGLGGGNVGVWFDAGIVWTSSASLPGMLTNTDSFMGIGNNGEFVLSTWVNGDSLIYTHDGIVLQEGEPAPGFSTLFVRNNRRPSMTPDGTAHWISSLGKEPQSAALHQVLYRFRPDAKQFEPLLSTFDQVDGHFISSLGMQYIYDVSDNLQHHAQVLSIAEGSDNLALYFDGRILMQRNSPTGQGDAWDSLHGVSVNDSGHSVVGGDTNGPLASDAFLAVNGVIRIREGMVIDGVPLSSNGMTASSRAECASLNNLGRVAHIWRTPGETKVLFHGDASALATTSRRVLATGDEVDFNGDNMADASVIQFHVSQGWTGPGVSLSDHDFLHLYVRLREDPPSTAEYDAVIRIPLPEPGLPCPSDVAGPGLGPDEQVNVNDLLLVINAWGAPPGSFADITGDGLVGIDDLLEIIGAWGPCP